MKIVELMEEVIRKDGLVFQHEVTDSYKGELYGYSRLFDEKSGDLISYIDWSAEGKDVWVRMIETKDRFKRQGYATKLLDSLKNYFPNKKIIFSSTTEEGEGLRKAYGIDLDEGIESKYPKRLNNEYEIADYIDDQSVQYVDKEFMEEYFKGSYAILKEVPVSSLKFDDEDHNIKVQKKLRKYEKMDVTTIPPLVVEDGIVKDGNHRLTVAKKLGLKNILIYDVKSKINESIESKNGILVFRGSVYGNKFGLTSKTGGPTFFSSKLAGALPYANNNKDDISAYMIYPKAIFDTSYKKYSDVYDQFLKETDHPARYGKTHRPFWTVEHELKKWLDKNDYNYDVIMFDENTGVPSYAVYDHSIISDNVKESLEEAQYHGRTVTLNKPIRAEQGSRKKFYVYVKNDKGNIVKVWFGDPNMRIKAYSPKHRKSFRARHKCSTDNDPTTPRYWSCKKW